MDEQKKENQKRGKHVTVLMPVYNNQAHVAQAIESILDQTHHDLDLVIVDDGSTDSTKEIIQGFALIDERIRLIFNTENLGIPKTRNVLLKNIDSNSEYFAILDGDDVAHPERIKKQIDFIEKRGIDGCGTNLKIIDEDGDEIGQRKYPETAEEIQKRILQFNPFAQSAMLIKKPVIDRVGFYNESLKRVQDYDMWIRIIKEGYKMENIQEDLVSFRVHQNQGKSKNNKASLWYSFVVRGRYIFLPQFFSLKGFVIWLGYIPALFLPRDFVVGLYKKLFVR